MSDLGYCPHCLRSIDWVLPDLPLYTLEQALAVIPATDRNHLYVILHRLRHELDEPRYVHGDYGRRYRLLTARDIQLINRRIKPTLRGVMRWLRAES
jgi:hypothetical protein